MSQDQADSRPRFRSDLSHTPLPEVLATIHRYRVPGVVECSREGGEIKRIYIDAGNIIFATSSNTADSLGDRLLSQGRISKEQYEASVRKLGEDGKRQGMILTEMEALDPKELFLSVREQVQAIVWSLFEWERGEVTFEPGRDKNQEFIKLEIPIQRAVLEGVRVAEPRGMLSRIGPRTTILENNPDATREDLPLGRIEEQLLQHIDGRTPLMDLTQVPPNTPADNARLLYAFFVLQLVRPKTPKQIKVHVRSSHAE